MSRPPPTKKLTLCYLTLHLLSLTSYMLNTFMRMARTTPPFKKLTGAAIALPLHFETQVRAAPSPKPGCTAVEFSSCILALQYITEAVNSSSIQKLFSFFVTTKP